MAATRKKSIKINAIFNTAKTLLSVAFPLITFPYVSRVLGVNQLGKYNFSSSVISYFLLIAALGISSYAIREGTQYRDDKQKIENFASQMFSINILSTLASYVLLFICLLLIRRFDDCRVEILIFSVEIIATTIGIEWLYNIYEDFVFIAVRSFIFQCISLGLLFMLVRGQNDVVNYVWVTVISQTGNSLLNWFHAKRYCKIKFTWHIDWKKHLKPILIIFSTTIAITIYVNSDTTMLGFLINDNNYSVGIYSVSTKIYNIFKNVIVSFLVVLIPRFSLLVHQDNAKEKVSALFNKLSTILITVASPMILGIIMLAPDIITIVSGKSYLQSVSSLRILMLACLFSFFAYLFAQCILIPYRKEKDFFIATLISASVNIGSNFIFIPLLRETGAAITTLIAEGITMALVFKASRGYINLQVKKKDIMSVLLGIVAVFFVCLIGYFLIDTMIFRVSFCIVLSFLLYWTILKVFHNSVLYDIELTIKKKLNFSKKGLS